VGAEIRGHSDSERLFHSLPSEPRGPHRYEHGTS
jgi:hypothetical protein